MVESRNRWWRFAGGALFLFTMLAGSPLRAYDAAKTPASPVPSDRWGTLEAAGIMGDGTGFAFHNDPTYDDVWWFDVGAENGWIFTVTGRGLQVYDARTNPSAPTLAGYGYGPPPSRGRPGGVMPSWQHSDDDFFLTDLATIAGNDSVVAVAARGQGMVIWDTSEKSNVGVHYQDSFNYTQEVQALTLGGTRYAFGLSDEGVMHYNVNVAQTYTKCGELASFETNCPGVYLGKLKGPKGGLSMSSTGNFLAVGGSASLEIWNVANVASPVKVLTASEVSRAIALWKQGAGYYLATSNGTTMKVFERELYRRRLLEPAGAARHAFGRRHRALPPIPHYAVIQPR